jgi:tetratricopeptide (TPR) repeat protein
MAQEGLLRKLREQLDNQQVVIIAGTGVSIETSGNARCASWSGLIADGIEYALQHDLIEESAAENLQKDLATNNFAEWPRVAQRVSEALQAPRGDFREWLRSSIGTLPKTTDALVDALHALGAPLATTNYDNLLQTHSGQLPIPWTDSAQVDEWVRGGPTRRVLHLHGHFDAPDSVVLGVDSYDRLLHDARAQSVQRALIQTRTFLFIGCGDGLFDPNFGAMLDWISDLYGGAPQRHFCLCRTPDKAILQKRFPSNRPLAYIAYGDDFDKLANFIRTELVSPSRRRRVQAAATLPVLSHCIGRDREVADVVAAFMADPPKRLPILGAPGSGKSTIAAKALHATRVAERFAARRWFLRCEAAESRSALMAMLAAALEITHEVGVEDAVIEALSERPSALVLDNLETPYKSDSEAVNQLLGKLSMIDSLALIATIRGATHPHGIPWAPSVHTMPLDADRAKEVFVTESGNQMFATDPHLDRLIGELDGLPLAIVLMAHFAQPYRSLEPVWRAWKAEHTRILDGIARSFELSIRPLSSSAKRLLAVIAMLPNGIAHEDVANVIDRGSASAHELRSAALVFDEAGRVRMLSPIREYLRDQRRDPRSSDAARAIQHYVRLAAAEAPRIGGWAGADAVRRLAPEVPTIETALTSPLTPLDEQLTAATLGWTMLIRFTGLGNPGVVELVASRARDAGMHEEAARCIHALGDIAVARTDFDTARAKYDEAQRLFAKAESAGGIAACEQGFGSIAIRRGDFKLARKRYEDALVVFQRIHDERWMAICIQSLADAFHRLGDYPEAQRQYEAARELFYKIDSPAGQASCLKSLGNIALRSDLACAGELFKQARKLYDAVANVRGQAKCIKGFGHIARLQGDYPAARAAYEEALPLYRQVGSVLGQAICMKGLAKIEFEQSRYPMARELYSQALALYRRLEDRQDSVRKCESKLVEIERLMSHS